MGFTTYMRRSARLHLGNLVLLGGIALLALELLAWFGHEMTEEPYDAWFFTTSAVILLTGMALTGLGFWLKKQAGHRTRDSD